MASASALAIEPRKQGGKRESHDQHNRNPFQSLVVPVRPVHVSLLSSAASWLYLNVVRKAAKSTGPQFLLGNSGGMTTENLAGPHLQRVCPSRMQFSDSCTRAPLSCLAFRRTPRKGWLSLNQSALRKRNLTCQCGALASTRQHRQMTRCLTVLRIAGQAIPAFG